MCSSYIHAVMCFRSRLRSQYGQSCTGWRRQHCGTRRGRGIKAWRGGVASIRGFLQVNAFLQPIQALHAHFASQRRACGAPSVAGAPWLALAVLTGLLVASACASAVEGGSVSRRRHYKTRRALLQAPATAPGAGGCASATASPTAAAAARAGEQREAQAKYCRRWCLQDLQGMRQEMPIKHLTTFSGPGIGAPCNHVRRGKPCLARHHMQACSRSMLQTAGTRLN